MSTKKGRAGRASLMHSVREALAREASLDQIPQPRKAFRVSVNGVLGDSAGRAEGRPGPACAGM